MALTFYWRAENSTTLDATHDYTVNDTTASNTSASFSTSAAYKGTYGILVPASTSSNYRFSATDIINNAATPASSVGSAAFMIKFPSAIPTTTGIFFGFRPIDISASGNSIQTVTGADNGSGAMKLSLSIGNATNGAVLLTTAEYCITADNWYAVVVRWDIPNDKRKIEVYNTSGTLVGSAEDTSTDLSANAPAVLTEIRWGRTTGHANDVYLDNLFVADTYNEPLQNNVLSISSYTEYDGSTAVKKLKLLAHASAASATGIEGVVLNSTRDTVIGEFSGKTFEASLESGKAVLKIPVADFGGTSLTTSDTPLALAKNTTKTTGLVSCTVIEE